MDHERATAVARRISAGHAYEKHVVEGYDFPEIKSREELAAVIFEVLTDPASLKRGLRDGREAFWNERHRVLVILDLLSEDCGTALRPTTGRTYFRGLR
jgi:filamentous hemagglutinin